MLRGLTTVVFWTDDVDAAAKWYSEFLGIEPYFEALGPDGRAAYREFRIGDTEDEFGLIDSRYSPSKATEPGGAIVYWHVDDLQATVERLLAMGAKEYQPITNRGEGFVTASVVDPWGNVLGVMYNSHYIEIAKSAQKP
jgi:predicted enzyme related to lactoylglutathione lyase